MPHLRHLHLLNLSALSLNAPCSLSSRCLCNSSTSSYAPYWPWVGLGALPSASPSRTWYRISSPGPWVAGRNERDRAEDSDLYQRHDLRGPGGGVARCTASGCGLRGGKALHLLAAAEVGWFNTTVNGYEGTRVTVPNRRILDGTVIDKTNKRFRVCQKQLARWPRGEIRLWLHVFESHVHKWLIK